jgi:hypothetical protein
MTIVATITALSPIPTCTLVGMPGCFFTASTVELPSCDPVAVGRDNGDEYVNVDVSTDVKVTSDMKSEWCAVSVGLSVFVWILVVFRVDVKMTIEMLTSMLGNAVGEHAASKLGAV